MIGEELPGPLQLCFAHTEQYRQNRDGWKIDWAVGAEEPTSVFAPPTWAAAVALPVPERSTDDPGQGKGPGWMARPNRLRDWSRARRDSRG